MLVYGDTRKVKCSWCPRTVVEVWRRYPPGAGLPGGFWDCSACPCGSPDMLLAQASSAAMRSLGNRSLDIQRTRH